MTSIRRLAFAVACIFAIVCTNVRADDFFPLGLWYEGGVGDARDNVLFADPAKAAPIYEKNFADIAAHGINLIVVPNSPPEHHKLVLDTAEKHHVKVILELGLDGGPFGHMIRGQRAMEDKAIDETLQNVLAPIKDHPALLRVQLLDEPPGDAFERYGHVAAAVRRFNPRTEPFCCLTGDSNGDAFVAASKSDVVAFDMYPLAPGAKEGDAKPLKDFATYADRFAGWAAKHDARSWAVIQCHAITGGLRFPTPAEVRCMTYSSLATGNKGVFWFLYQSEQVGQAMMDGLVDRQFKSRPLWNEVGKLAKELAPLTDTLAKLKPAPIKLESNADLARTFTDGFGNTYVIAVNFDTVHAKQIALKLPGDYSALKRLVRGTSEDATNSRDALTWSAKIDPGDGAIFRVR